MAGRWSRDEAGQDQISATVEEAVEQARRCLPEGESLTHCQESGEAIPDARRKAIPGVRLCVRCQSELEEGQPAITASNRRGSKGSQLKEEPARFLP